MLIVALIFLVITTALSIVNYVILMSVDIGQIKIYGELKRNNDKYRELIDATLGLVNEAHEFQYKLAADERKNKGGSFNLGDLTPDYSPVKATVGKVLKDWNSVETNKKGKN